MARSTTTRRKAASSPRQAPARALAAPRRAPGLGPGGPARIGLRNGLASGPPARAQGPPDVASAAPNPAAPVVIAPSQMPDQPTAAASSVASLATTVGLTALEADQTQAAPQLIAAAGMTGAAEAPTAAQDTAAIASSDGQPAPSSTPFDTATPAALDNAQAVAPATGDAPIDAAQTAPVSENSEAIEEAPAEPSPRAAIAPAASAVGRRATTASVHQPSGAATGQAIAASNRPGMTQRRNAQGAGVAAADAAETGSVDQPSFEEDLRAAIARAMPDVSSESDARDVMAEGASQAAAEVQGTLGEQQTVALGNLPTTVSEDMQPDPTAQEGGEEVALVPEEIGPDPEGVSAGPVVPPASTAAAVDTSSNRAATDTLAADNNITDSQLSRGNDQQFQATLGARDAAETHDREAPAALREAETTDRQNTHARSAGAITAGLGGFQSSRTTQLGDVATQQTTTQTDTERRKLEITEDIEAIGLAVRTDVTRILGEMQTETTALFQTAIDEAMDSYDAAFDAENGGFFTSVGDFLTGDWGDERFNRALALGRRAFETRIETAITDISALVERKLIEARDRVSDGRTEIETYMTNNVSEAERELAEEATTAITADFEALEGEISDSRDALVSNMVDIYRQGIERRNAREEQLQEENKSIWERVYDATVGVIQKVLEFKNMLLSILSRAAAVIEAIIQDPIGFLRNLIAGIGAGLNRFVANIGENLKNALMGWLFGALEGAGIKMPDKFDLAGFLDIVLQVLGLTKENVRARAVRILGEDMVSKIEGAVDFLRILFTEGPAGIWQMLLEKLGNIKDVIIDEIKSWVITKIVEAGIKWIIGLLNPAGAFIKACMMIYDIVIFFIERGQQIIAAVNAIINALGTIVAGNIGAMAEAVEGALNRILPVVIGFLASLLGLGGISETIRGFIEKVQEPVNKAIDWVINLGVSMARKIAGLFGGKEDPNVDEDADDPEKELKLQRARDDLLVFEAEQGDEGGVDVAEAEAIATKLKQNHPVVSGVRIEAQDDHWVYFISASAERATPGIQKRLGGPPTGVIDIGGGEWKISPFIDVSFNVREKFVEAGLDGEYIAQLNEQSAGMNRMYVYDWLRNRADYEGRSIAARAARAAGDTTATARDPRAGAAQRSVRSAHNQNRFAVLLQELGNDPRNAGMEDDELVDFVETVLEEEMSQLHALHNSDQIAGGHFDSAGHMRMGSSRVNMSMGAQWRHVPAEERAPVEAETQSAAANGEVIEESPATPRSRIDLIQQAVEGLELTDEQRTMTKMNVRLTAHFI